MKTFFNSILAMIIGYLPFFLIGLVIGHFGGFNSKESSAIVNAVGFWITYMAVSSPIFKPFYIVGIGCAIYAGLYL